MTPITDNERRDLFEVLDDRHGTRCTIILAAAGGHAAPLDARWRERGRSNTVVPAQVSCREARCTGQTRLSTNEPGPRTCVRSSQCGPSALGSQVIPDGQSSVRAHVRTTRDRHIVVLSDIDEHDAARPAQLPDGVHAAATRNVLCVVSSRVVFQTPSIAMNSGE
jgi:hypothetical protein